MADEPSLDGIGLKELGKFKKEVKETLDDMSKPQEVGHDLYSELMIELDGISELTGIDPNKFLRVVGEKTPDYEGVVKNYRRRVFEKTGGGLTEHMIQAVVDSMISLNLLKNYVLQAGGYELALDYICHIYVVSKNDLSVDMGGQNLSASIIGEDYEIKEASRIITSSYGSTTALHLQSLFIASKVGKLICVKDGNGTILGVIQLLYDRFGDSFIHSYSVLKQYRGSGVGSMLLDAVEDNAKGDFIWAGRSLNLIYNIRNLLEKGFTGCFFVPNVFGGEKPMIVFERNLKVEGGQVRVEVGDVPCADSICDDVRAFKTSIGNTDLIQEALNDRGFEIVDYDVGDGDDTLVVMLKTDGMSMYGHRNKVDDLPVYDGGFKVDLIESYGEMEDAVELTRQTNFGPGVDYAILRVINLVGSLIAFRDSEGRMVAFTGLLLDGEGGIFCHSISSLPSHNLNPGIKLLRYAVDFAKASGNNRVSFIHCLDDMQTIREAVNNDGFVATKEYLNPYDDGYNYLHLELDFTREAAGGGFESAVFLKNIMDLEPEYRQVLVSPRNYALVDLVLGAGYRVTKVVDAGVAGEQTQPTFLMEANTL